MVGAGARGAPLLPPLLLLLPPLLLRGAAGGLADSVVWAVNAGGDAHVDVNGIHFRKDPLEGRVGRGEGGGDGRAARAARRGVSVGPPSGPARLRSAGGGEARLCRRRSGTRLPSAPSRLPRPRRGGSVGVPAGPRWPGQARRRGLPSLSRLAPASRRGRTGDSEGPRGAPAQPPHGTCHPPGLRPPLSSRRVRLGAAPPPPPPPSPPRSGPWAPVAAG